MLAPIRRNFVLEIVNNDEFGRYHFRGAHLAHAESGNLRDEEVAYNLFYWTRGIFRVITDADPPAKETVSIPWPNTDGFPTDEAMVSSWCMGLKSPEAPA